MLVIAMIKERRKDRKDKYEINVDEKNVGSKYASIIAEKCRKICNFCLL
jgi:hypothetical protein